MKIAILTSGILPVPAVQGGAVENLTDFYLEYNNQCQLHDITVYSVWHPDVMQHPALQSTVNHYHFIDTTSPWAKIRKRFYHWKNKQIEYYHYTIEYFLHEAIKNIRTQNFDIIILENRPGYSLQLGKYKLPPLIFHLHNDILNNSTNQHATIYQAAKRIITVSNYITRRVQTIDPHDTKCLAVLNGIDIKSFTVEEKGTDYHDLTIIFCGRLIPEKGLLPLVMAMKKLKETPSIKLLVVGGASLGNLITQTEYQKEIYHIAKQLSNITFTGYVDYKKIGQYLRKADIAVLPSLWDEPFGLTCVEAMASGLPIITTSQGGIPEVVDNSCAIILDVNEQLSNDIAVAILDLYHHPEKRKAMSKAAIKRSKFFSKERYAEDFFEALR